jgi:hypothetical protein
MKIYETCFDNKVVDILNGEKGKKAILLFNHGLGDFVLFLPLFQELCNRSPDWDLYIGCSPNRNFKFLHPKCIIVDSPYGKYSDTFDIIMNIVYPEPPRDEKELQFFNSKFSVKNIETISKPYLCNELEIGLKNFEWKPYEFPWEEQNYNSKTIGVHFFGHTSVENKDADNLVAKYIWKEIKKCDFNPFEIQMVPLNTLRDVEVPDFITKEESLRFQFPNLRLMVSKLLECKLFIGVDSGPIYLAGSLIGFDKVLGLQRKREFKKVLPEKITILDIDRNIDSEIRDWIEGNI